MPVRADWSGVVDYVALHEDDYQRALTQSFYTAGWGYGWFDVLGISDITAENVGEVWARLSILQGMGVIGMRKGRERIRVTENDVIRRIGMSSNYGTLTRAKWITEKLKPIMNAVAEETLDTAKLTAKELQVT